MRNLSKSLLGLWLIGMGFGVSAPAQAASAVRPYYAMPARDQTLPAATRFIVLTNMASQAVLDRETGLVWGTVAGYDPSNLAERAKLMPRRSTTP